ncbi:hypothetical protein V4B17_00170 [Bartonella sp. B23]
MTIMSLPIGYEFNSSSLDKLDMDNRTMATGNYATAVGAVSKVSGSGAAVLVFFKSKEKAFYYFWCFC